MEELIYKRFVIVKDHFYTDPQKVLMAANQAVYHEPQHVTGYRSLSVYHEKGVKQRLEKILGIKITRWDVDPIEENGVFYQGFSKGKRKKISGIK